MSINRQGERSTLLWGEGGRGSQIGMRLTVKDAPSGVVVVIKESFQRRLKIRSG